MHFTLAMCFLPILIAKWDRVCRGMKNDVVSFACIQGMLPCVKPSLNIFQLIFYFFGEILNRVGVIVDIVSPAKRRNFKRLETFGR